MSSHGTPVTLAELRRARGWLEHAAAGALAEALARFTTAPAPDEGVWEEMQYGLEPRAECAECRGECERCKGEVS